MTCLRYDWDIFGTFLGYSLDISGTYMSWIYLGPIPNSSRNPSIQEAQTSNKKQNTTKPNTKTKLNTHNKIGQIGTNPYKMVTTNEQH